MFDDRILSVDALPFLWPHAVCALAAYLLGSVPFSLVLTRMAGLGDIRKIGSGNIGATNVLRTGNKPLAAAVVLLDGGKGAAAVVAGFGVGGHDFAVIAALGAVLGHMFPVWLRFRGGKGVATCLGVTLGLSWPAGLVAGAVWLAAAAAVRMSSVGGMASALAAPAALWYVTGDMQYVQTSALIAVLVVARHRANIRRLLRGEEPRIGGKA